MKISRKVCTAGGMRIPFVRSFTAYDRSKMNIKGGSFTLGHPFGTDGGMGVAAIIER